MRDKNTYIELLNNIEKESKKEQNEFFGNITNFFLELYSKKL